VSITKAYGCLLVSIGSVKEFVMLLRRQSISLLVFVLIMLALIFPVQSTRAFEARQRQGFPAILPTSYVRFGSPTLADITGDNKLEILVATTDGYLHAVTHTGVLLWTADISTMIDTAAVRVGFSPSPGRIPIRTKPAVATVDGNIVIAVTVGEVFPQNAGDAAYNGGAVLLDKDGKLMPGWPQFPLDFIGGGDPMNPAPPDGHPDGILSSPTIGTITRDGKPVVVYGANDQRVYAKTLDGKDLPGWPMWILDTVWSSPSLADITGDGINEVIIGVDAHFYRGLPRFSEEGGDLYIFRGEANPADSESYIVWRASQDEIFQSSTAVADLDGDGKPEIAAGTGTFYGNLRHVNAQGVRVGQYFSVWNHDGSLRWRVDLPDRVFGSPAIGDLNGDGVLDIVVGVLNGVVYAFDGTSTAGNVKVLWATEARDIFNASFNVFSPVLGDYTGNGRDDVFIAVGWDVAVMRGTDGVLLTATNPIDPAKPSFYASYTINNTPAVGDLDGDGKLELISASASTNDRPPFDPINARINVWNLPDSTAKASWPQFRNTADNRGVIAPPEVLRASASQIRDLIAVNTTREYRLDVRKGQGQSVAWTVTKTDPNNIIMLSQTSLAADELLVFTVNGNKPLGSYAATLTISSPDLTSVDVPVNIEVKSTVNQIYLPNLTR
jgi:hypothetical protein